MSAFTDWMKQQAGDNTKGALGKGILGAGFVADLASGESHLKAVLKLLKEIVLMKPGLMLMGTAAFGGMSKMVKSLVGELGQFSNALKKVKEEYARVQEKMAKGLAKPFEQAEIENTKKMTKAMEAMVPVVNRLAKTYHAIYGGVSTFKASMVQTVATSKIGRDAIEGFGTALAVVIPIISAISAIKLGNWFKNLGGSMALSHRSALTFGKGVEAMSFGLLGANKSARVALGGINALKTGLSWSGVLAGAAVIGAVIIGLVGLYNSVKEANKELARFAAENTRANNAMNAQISAINTLADKYNVLATAIDAAAEARRKYREVQEERSLIGWMTGTDEKKSNQAKAQAATAQAAVERTKRAPVEKDRRSDTLQRDLTEQSRRQDFENRLSRATPEQQRVMLAEEIARTGALASRGAADVDAQSRTSEALGKLGVEDQAAANYLKEAEARLAASYAKGTADTAMDGGYMDRLEKNMETVRERKELKQGIKITRDAMANRAKERQRIMSGSGSETMAAQAELDAITAARNYQEAKGRGIPNDAGRGEALRKQKLDMKLGEAVGGGYIGMDGGKLMEMQAAARTRLELAQKNATPEEILANKQANKQREEERRISEINAGLTRQDARTGLQGQTAEVQGNFDEADTIRLAAASAKRALELEAGGLGAAEAKTLAGAELHNSISLQQRQGNMAADAAAAVSSMARVGGGGGVEEVQNDLLSVAQRHLEVSTRMEQILTEIKNIKAGIPE
jgi:hypothetical protein